MHITTIAVFVQSIRNQFIVYDCKNKLCRCQPILLIFLETICSAKKMIFNTLKHSKLTQIIEISYLTPPKKISMDLHRSQKWPRQRKKKGKSTDLRKTFIPVLYGYNSKINHWSKPYLYSRSRTRYSKNSLYV